MSDEEVQHLLETGGMIAVRYFDGAMVKIEQDNLPVEDALPALKNFLALTTEQRRSDARHLIAYCKMMVDAVGEEVLEKMGGRVPNEEEVWAHVSIQNLFFGKLDTGKYVSKPTVFVQIEGNVAWEPEHGLQMSWADGSRLVKVGAFDGHPTNSHATADPTRDQYVFSCYKPDLCTLPDSH